MNFRQTIANGFALGVFLSVRTYVRFSPVKKGKSWLRGIAVRVISRTAAFPERLMPVSISGVTVDLWFFPSSVVGATVWLFGFYEMKDVDICVRSLAGGKNAVLLDVGANCGIYSLVAACSRPSVRVLAIEPDPEAVRLLRRNVADQAERLRALGSSVEVEGVALGETEGEARFVRAQDQALGSFHRPPSRHSDVIVVPTCRGDELLKHWGVDVIDFCKLDIEGGELAALRGLEQTFRQRKIRLLQIELNEPICRLAGHSSGDLIKILDDYGYEMMPSSRALYPAAEWNDENFYFKPRTAGGA